MGERGYHAYRMRLGHLEQVDGVPSRRISLRHMTVFCQKHQQTAPIHPPNWRQINHVSVQAVLFRVAIIVLGQKMPGPISSELRIDILNARVAGHGAEDVQRLLRIQHRKKIGEDSGRQLTRLGEVTQSIGIEEILKIR